MLLWLARVWVVLVSSDLAVRCDLTYVMLNSLFLLLAKYAIVSGCFGRMLLVCTRLTVVKVSVMLSGLLQVFFRGMELRRDLAIMVLDFGVFYYVYRPLPWLALILRF